MQSCHSTYNASCCTSTSTAYTCYIAWAETIYSRLAVPSQIHRKGDEEIAGMSIYIHVISTAADILVYMSIEDITAAIIEDAELQMVQTNIIRGWPPNKEELEPMLAGYWPIRNDLAMTDGVAMKGKQIIIPFTLQKQILDQLHSSHMG